MASVGKKYTLRYLPLFEQDLAEARDYIACVLHNPFAALRLIEDAEKAIVIRLRNPLAFEPYHSVKNREHAYYRIRVRSFAVFYVVLDDVMEVRRFVHSKRNLAELI